MFFILATIAFWVQIQNKQTNNNKSPPPTEKVTEHQNTNEQYNFTAITYHLHREVQPQCI